MRRLVIVTAAALLLTGCAATSPAQSPHPTHTQKLVYAPIFNGTTTVKDAEDELHGLGLKYLVVPQSTGTPEPDWYVMSSVPSAKNVRPGSKVQILAQAPVAVPNFVGMTVAQAKAAAQTANVTLRSTGAADDWNITSQDLLAGGAVRPGATVTVNAAEPPQFITYSVTGNGTANVITYSTGGTGSSQASGVRLPWSTQIPAGGGFLYVSAQDGSGTTITCTITGPTGAVLSQNTATGRYAIAQCNG